MSDNKNNKDDDDVLELDAGFNPEEDYKEYKMNPQEREMYTNMKARVVNDSIKRLLDIPKYNAPKRMSCCDAWTMSSFTFTMSMIGVLMCGLAYFSNVVSSALLSDASSIVTFFNDIEINEDDWLDMTENCDLMWKNSDYRAFGWCQFRINIIKSAGWLGSLCGVGIATIFTAAMFLCTAVLSAGLFYVLDRFADKTIDQSPKSWREGKSGFLNTKMGLILTLWAWAFLYPLYVTGKAHYLHIQQQQLQARSYESEDLSSLSDPLVYGNTSTVNDDTVYPGALPPPPSLLGSRNSTSSSKRQRRVRTVPPSPVTTFLNWARSSCTLRVGFDLTTTFFIGGQADKYDAISLGSNVAHCFFKDYVGEEGEQGMLMRGWENLNILTEIGRFIRGGVYAIQNIRTGGLSGVFSRDGRRLFSMLKRGYELARDLYRKFYPQSKGTWFDAALEWWFTTV